MTRTAVLAVGLAAGAPAGAAFAADTQVTLATSSGPVIGSRDGSVDAFLGIPYAAPPVGALRFRPPVPPAPWTQPLPALADGPPCPQTAALGTPSVDEACLTLDVYAPAGPRLGPAAGRPVLVFLYGGSFEYGATRPGAGSTGPNYDGARLAAATGAVVVTVNYRLGALGFLALPALDAENAAGVSGNYGLLDQQRALRWVRDNLASLGGDPSHVVLFGQSAGAVSAIEQMVSPAARGLFSAAEIESAGAVPAGTLASAENDNASFLAAVGCAGASDTAACLRALPVAELLAHPIAAGPVIDGVVIPAPPMPLIAAGRAARIPVVEGTNLDEGTFFVGKQEQASGAIGLAGMATVLARTFGAEATAIAARYPADAGVTPAQALSAILTDEFFACPAAAFRREAAPWSGVVQYEFAEPDPVLDYPVPTGAPGLTLGDTHTSELAYVFGHDGGDAPLPAGPDAVLSAEIMGVIDLLARLPATGGLIGDAGGPVLEYASPLRLSDDFATRHQCAFWDASGVEGRMLPYD